MAGQDQKEPQRRGERRQEIALALLPFMGSRVSDYLAFEYLLMDTSVHGARIAIPRWVVSRDYLQVDELINLHVPFRLAQEIYDQGRVAWAKWSEEDDSQICGVQLIRKPPLHTPAYMRLGSGEVRLDLPAGLQAHQLVIRIIKDMALLKKGMLVYLDHLVSYFSRLTRVSSRDYSLLRDFLFEEAKSQLLVNHAQLREIHSRLAKELKSDQEIGSRLVLEELRPPMESELYADLFRTALESPAVDPYLEAIKELEKKLYSGYNTLALIYLGSVDL